MDDESSAKFMSSLSKLLNSFCSGYVKFDKGVEVMGHIYLSVDSEQKLDFILDEKVCKINENFLTLTSNSFHAQPARKKPMHVPEKLPSDDKDNTDNDQEGLDDPVDARVHSVDLITKASLVKSGIEVLQNVDLNHQDITSEDTEQLDSIDPDHKDSFSNRLEFLEIQTVAGSNNVNVSEAFELRPECSGLAKETRGRIKSLGVTQEHPNIVIGHLSGKQEVNVSSEIPVKASTLDGKVVVLLQQNLTSEEPKKETALDNALDQGHEKVNKDLQKVKTRPRPQRPRHQCEMCGKTYLRKSNLVRHNAAHSGVKPFRCKWCGKSFAVSEGLNQHIRVHTNERPYKCQDCGKSFKQRSHLRDHIGVHAEDKVNMCDLCGKTFATLRTLKRHRLVHIREIIHYECDVCSKVFLRKPYLINHKKVHAKENLQEALEHFPIPGTQQAKKKKTKKNSNYEQ